MYASDDYVAGLKAGQKFSPQTYKLIPESRAPIAIDNHNWMYIDKTKIILVHEIYDKDQYIRTDQIVIPKRLLL